MLTEIVGLVYQQKLNDRVVCVSSFNCSLNNCALLEF